MKRIEGKVAQVLTDRDLVINKGAADGVKEGMTFKILNPRGSEVRDPDTNEVLGSVELVKILVKIVEVDAKLSVGRTFKKVFVPGRPSTSIHRFSSSLASSIFGDEGTPDTVRVETLRSDEPFASQDIDPADSFINRGDPAVQVVTQGDVEY